MQENVFFDKDLGNMLRERRLELGWDADQTASLYGETLRGAPITRKAYLRMEEGYLPKSPKRRLILAAMFGLAPLALGIEPPSARSIKPIARLPRGKTLDLQEYQSALLAYWKGRLDYYCDSPIAALQDISQRIHKLHSNVLYTSSPEKERMKQLLWGFHIRYGQMARIQGFEKPGLEHFKNAMNLAHEEGFVDLEAPAIHYHGAFYFDKGEFKRAVSQFQRSLDLNPVPSAQGCTLALKGFAQASMATSDQDLRKALTLIDESEKTLGTSPTDEISQIAFTPESFLLFKAHAFMASPDKRLRSPNAAEELITEVTKPTKLETGRASAFRDLETNLVLAQIWLDRGYYAIATTFAQDSLRLHEELGSSGHLQFFDLIYEQLRLSSYGKDMEVAKLGIQLAKLRHIQMFND